MEKHHYLTPPDLHQFPELAVFQILIEALSMARLAIAAAYPDYDYVEAVGPQGDLAELFAFAAVIGDQVRTLQSTLRRYRDAAERYKTWRPSDRNSESEEARKKSPF